MDTVQELYIEILPPAEFSTSQLLTKSWFTPLSQALVNHEGQGLEMVFFFALNAC